MMHSVNPKSLSPQQISLLHHALQLVFKIDDTKWSEMPLDERFSLAKYMGEDVWTHLPDLLTLREAALMIVRDAIARTGEFDGGEDVSVRDIPPRQASGAEIGL